MNNGREFRQNVLVKITEEICFSNQGSQITVISFSIKTCNCEGSKAFSLTENYTDTIITYIYPFTIVRKLLKLKV